MPIEREFKYVLRLTDTLEDELKAYVLETNEDSYDIQQGYLSKGGRVRSRKAAIFVGHVVDETLDSEISRNYHQMLTDRYIFTYKHDLEGRKKGVLEIECDISKADFDLAWTDADHKIEKTRYVVFDPQTRLTWEIDFFRNSGKTYFCLAECEVSVDADEPTILHPFVEKHFILAVDETDSRFNNRKLSDPHKVAKLLKEIA